jgi:hypothetical protein
MSPQQALLTYAFLGAPVGLLTGLLLGLVAQHDGGWGGYGSFPRRAARLGHVALVMLPFMAGLYALALGDHGADTLAGWAALLWIGSGVLLPAALFASAWRRRWRFALPLPALALAGAAVLFALAHLRA